MAQYRQKEVAQHGSREAFHQAQLREVEQKVALRRTELTFGGPRTKDGSPDKRTKEWKVRPVLPIVVGTWQKNRLGVKEFVVVEQAWSKGHEGKTGGD